MDGSLVDEIVKLADDLGRQIAETERFQNLRKAENAAENDTETRDLMQETEQYRKRIAEKEGQHEPIEPDEKRELQRLSDAVEANDHLQTLARAQVDFLELMKRVDDAIRARLT